MLHVIYLTVKEHNTEILSQSFNGNIATLSITSASQLTSIYSESQAVSLPHYSSYRPATKPLTLVYVSCVIFADYINMQ